MREKARSSRVFSSWRICVHLSLCQTPEGQTPVPPILLRPQGFQLGYPSSPTAWASPAGEARHVHALVRMHVLPQRQLKLKGPNTAHHNATVASCKSMTRTVDFMNFCGRDVFVVDRHVREGHDRVIAAVVEKDAFQP